MKSTLACPTWAEYTIWLVKNNMLANNVSEYFYIGELSTYINGHLLEYMLIAIFVEKIDYVCAFLFDLQKKCIKIVFRASIVNWELIYLCFI